MPHALWNTAHILRPLESLHSELQLNPVVDNKQEKTTDPSFTADSDTDFPDFAHWPESKLAILAEGFVVERGKLARLRAHSLKPAPASVRPLADSRARWGLADK